VSLVLWHAELRLQVGPPSHRYRWLLRARRSEKRLLCGSSSSDRCFLISGMRRALRLTLSVSSSECRRGLAVRIHPVSPSTLILCASRRMYPDSKSIDDRVKTSFVNRYYGHAGAVL